MDPLDGPSRFVVTKHGVRVEVTHTGVCPVMREFGGTQWETPAAGYYCDSAARRAPAGGVFLRPAPRQSFLWKELYMPCLFVSSRTVQIALIHELVLFGRLLESPPSARLYVVGIGKRKSGDRARPNTAGPISVTMTHGGRIDQPEAFGLLEGDQLSWIGKQIAALWPGVTLAAKGQNLCLTARAKDLGLTQVRGDVGGEDTETEVLLGPVKQDIRPVRYYPEQDPVCSSFEVVLPDTTVNDWFCLSLCFDTRHSIELRGPGFFTAALEGPEHAMTSIRAALDDARSKQQEDRVPALEEVIGLWDMHCVKADGYTVSVMPHSHIQAEVVAMGRKGAIPDQRSIRTIPLDDAPQDLFLQPTSPADCFVFNPGHAHFIVPMNFVLKQGTVLLPPTARASFARWAARRTATEKGDRP